MNLPAVQASSAPAPLPALTCPDCGAPMHLRETRRYTYPNGRPRKFWGCSRFPGCKSTIAAHPNGAPSSTPADAPTKAARVRAHEAFDRLWKRELGGTMGRVEAYRWMRRLMGMTEEDAHIGKFGTDQCELLIRKLAEAVPQIGGAAC